MPDLYEDYVVDPSTGQTIRLPASVGAYMGLPRKSQDPVYPPESGGDDPAARVPHYSWEDTPVDVATNAMRSTVAANQRAALPENVRNGTYDTYDPSDIPPTRVADRQPIGGWNGIAHIAQATGPMGTINQIGEPVDTTSAVQRPMATQADLDAFNRENIPAAPQGPYDPNQPEQAGADLQRQGVGLQERAAIDSAAADQKESVDVEAEMKRRNDELNKQREDNARQQKEWEQRRNEIQANVTQKTDDWANYKIDRGRRWRNAGTGQKLAAVISVAMTALGDALQYKSGPNMSIKMITDTIDADVDDQVREREHLGQVASRARSSLDDYRQTYGDWQQARAAKLAEEYKRTADEIERISAATKGDKAKANALAMAGDLRTRAGALEQGIATSAWNREMKLAEFNEAKRSARVAEGQRAKGLSLQESQFNEEMKFKREQLAAQQKASVDEYLAKASAEQAKNLRESGIKDPTTGQYIISDGQPVMSRNAAEAGKIQETVDGTQTMLSTIDRIKAKIASDPGFAALNPTQKQAALASELDSLTLLIKDAYGTGALDKGSIEFTNNYTGGDPTKLTSKSLFSALGLGDSKADVTSAKLDVVAQTAETRALNRLGNPKGFKFARDEKVQETPANKAAADVYKEASLGNATTEGAVEAAGGQKSVDVPKGALPTGIVPVSLPSTGVQSVTGDKPLLGAIGAAKDWLSSRSQRNAEESPDNSVKYPGFRTDREPALDTLVQGARAGDKQSERRILDMVADQKTPGMSDAAITLVKTVRSEVPGLYEKALKELPEDKRNLLIAIDAARFGVPLYDTGIPVNKVPPAPIQSGPVTSPRAYSGGRNQ